MTNTLAYYSAKLITAVKIFMTQAPGGQASSRVSSETFLCHALQFFTSLSNATA
jgi:hypothetical protein